MCVLRGRIRFENSALCGIIFAAVSFGDKVFCRLRRFVGNAERVSSHICDKTVRSAVLRTEVYTLVKLLRDEHRASGLKSEPLCRLLLQGRRDERGIRRAVLSLNVAPDGDELSVFAGVKHFLRIFSGCKLNFTVFVPEELCGELYALRSFQNCFNRPVFLRYESGDFRLSFNDYSRCHRLNSPCGKSAADGLPEVRTYLVSDDSVQNSSRLLGVYKVHINRAGVLHSFENGFLRYIVEGDPVRLLRLYAENRREMP